MLWVHYDKCSNDGALHKEKKRMQGILSAYYFPWSLLWRSHTSWGRCGPDTLENRGWTHKSREHNHHQTVTFSLIHSLDRSKLPSDCVSCPPSFSIQFLLPLKFCPKFMSKWPVLKLRKQTTQTPTIRLMVLLQTRWNVSNRLNWFEDFVCSK